jgi:tetratricopeptide (TPR) repeat protein
MLINNLPTPRENIKVTPRPIELVLAEDGLTPLILVLEPLEDIAEMHAQSDVSFSLKEFATSAWEKLQPIFASELEMLKNKSDRFHDAPTFFNRLANLAELSGDRIQEESYLQLERNVVDDEFVTHRLGENLIARNLLNDAEIFFANLNNEHDAFVNLRLAYFHILKKDLETALLYVNRAVSIDPLDFGARLFEGSLYLIRREYKSAIQSFRFAAEERQTSSPLFANLALAYIYIDKPEKAFASLRKAVALDPSNENAIALLADFAFSKNRNEEAVPSLRYFLEYEQKTPMMWSRLARALLELGKTSEAIAALKRQGSVEKSRDVWINLGVAYHQLPDRKKAYEAFKYAMKLDEGLGSEEDSRSLFLAARNLTALLLEDREYKNVLAMSKAVFADDTQNILLPDSQLADLYIFYITALHRMGATKEAVKVSEEILSREGVTESLVAWLVASLLAFYSQENESTQLALNLAQRYEEFCNSLGKDHKDIKEVLINNLAFVYLEADQVESAKKYLQKLDHAYHNESYPTATLGLYHMRMGNYARGEHLYEEAIHLAKTLDEKKRIRQKLNFECGLQYLNSEPSRARRYLQKVLENNESPMAARARALLNSLTQPK